MAPARNTDDWQVRAGADLNVWGRFACVELGLKQLGLKQLGFRQLGLKQHRLGGQEAVGQEGGWVGRGRCAARVHYCWCVSTHQRACGGAGVKGGCEGVGKLCKECSGLWGMARGRYASAESGLCTAMGSQGDQQHHNLPPSCVPTLALE